MSEPIKAQATFEISFSGKNAPSVRSQYDKAISELDAALRDFTFITVVDRFDGGGRRLIDCQVIARNESMRDDYGYVLTYSLRHGIQVAY